MVAASQGPGERPSSAGQYQDEGSAKTVPALSRTCSQTRSRISPRSAAKQDAKPDETGCIGNGVTR